MGRIPQLVQHMPAPVGIRPRGGAVATPWYLVAGVTPIAAYQPKGAASLAASYINLINPGTYNAAPGVAPTFNTATGWTFNGTTQYLNSGVVHGQNWTIIAQFSGASDSASVMCGAQDAGDTALSVSPYFNLFGANRAFYGNGGVIAVSTGLASGNLCSAGNQGYKNGVAHGAAIPAWSGVNTRSVYMGAYNNTGTADFFMAVTIIALALYNSALNATQVATTAAAMAAL